MAMVRFTFLVLFLAWGIPRDCASQRYVVLAPNTVRPHTAYDLVVTNLEATTQQFLFEIVNSNETVVGTSSVAVSPNELRNVQMSLEGLGDRRYRLKVWKDQKQVLINATELEYIDRSYLVLFQTDKPVYKAGDRVQFRVVFLFPNTYPVAETARPSIFITDPGNFRIKQWISASLTNGVFEGSFQLAEYTTLGRWTIGATLNSQHYEDDFIVEEYTLPLFKIVVQSIPNAYFHCKDKNMKIKVRALFANGGSVRGNATVVVRANVNNIPTETEVVSHGSGVLINGVAILAFRTKYVSTNCDEERNVWFDVTVTENSTGVSYNITSLMTVRNTEDATMEVLDGINAFYPGLTLRLKAKLTTLDEKPLKDQSVSIYYTVRDANDTITEGMLPGKTNLYGIFKFTINTKLTTTEVNVEGIYKNQNFSLVSAYPIYDDTSVEYLVAHTQQAYYIMGKNITVNVYSNVLIKRVYYIGYCCGVICVKGVDESPRPVHNHQFTLMSKPPMKPQMKLLLFAVKKDGKVLSFSTVIRVKPSKYTSLRITSTRKEPNIDRVVFNITAESDAFVGMLGVDERTLQRPTVMNDISQRKLKAATNDDIIDVDNMWSSYDSFSNVGVELLTDGHLPDVGYIPHLFGDTARAATDSNDEYNLREYFPETWIWQSLKVPDGGMETFEKSLPDTITTWVVNGFSVDQVNGLQMMRQPLQIKSSKPIFAQLFMPPSIKRWEQATVHCLVHNRGMAATVSLEVRSILNTTLHLAQDATETVPVTLHSTTVGTMSVDVFLRTPEGEIIDALRQSIPVRPEGLMKTVEDVRIIDFPKPSKSSFGVTLPVIKDVGSIQSVEVTLSVIGTFLNLHSFDLEQMVISSHGNGEENLLFLQTTVAVYEYLQRAELLPAGTKQKLLSYMEVAYQQQLQYRLKDGSYSIFGSLHECGGVWFTASTVESLRKLSKYITVEEQILSDGLNWLVRQSKTDGSFNESCTIVHPHIQRTGGKELSLASSVLFAFVGGVQVKSHDQFVTKTLALLRKSPTEDVYLLAKTSYLLALMDHPESAKMLVKLNKKAITDGKYRYWRSQNREPTATANIRDQETTAYALLANIKRNTIDRLEMIRVAHWLQKHSFTGDHYIKSLERIIALEALSMVADKIPTPVPNMRLEAEGYKLDVNSTNQQLLQSVILPKDIRQVQVSANGIGLVVLKLSYRYSVSNATEAAINRHAPISVQRSANNNKFTLELSFRTDIYPPNFYGANIWKADIVLPTGYTIEGQKEINGNATMSSVLLENGSQLELVWDGRNLPLVMYIITAHCPWQFVNVPKGLIYLSSFVSKDFVAVQPF